VILEEEQGNGRKRLEILRRIDTLLSEFSDPSRAADGAVEVKKCDSCRGFERRLENFMVRRASPVDLAQTGVTRDIDATRCRGFWRQVADLCFWRVALIGALSCA
jgi:hypothetical protein